ncbi:hypothetical protein NPIL_658731 [Nephila pilipes]|uniref:Uncharacterized protein n=1 Tax=Nephila pilipes TaxID=299642 RepID=A0A8X6U1A6_NEPPI|nr:hypothetical protein NPIL_658731 [Nephila pilipes]
MERHNYKCSGIDSSHSHGDHNDHPLQRHSSLLTFQWTVLFVPIQRHTGSYGSSFSMGQHWMGRMRGGKRQGLKWTLELSFRSTGVEAPDTFVSYQKCWRQEGERGM